MFWVLKKPEAELRICRSQAQMKALKHAHVVKHDMGLDARKPVCGGVRTTKAQTSLRIHTV